MSCLATRFTSARRWFASTGGPSQNGPTPFFKRLSLPLVKKFGKKRLHFTGSANPNARNRRTHDRFSALFSLDPFRRFSRLLGCTVAEILVASSFTPVGILTAVAITRIALHCTPIACASRQRRCLRSVVNLGSTGNDLLPCVRPHKKTNITLAIFF